MRFGKGDSPALAKPEEFLHIVFAAPAMCRDR